MRTTDEIYNALISNFAEGSGAAVTEGGDLSLRFRAVAAEIFSLEAQADFFSRQCFPQSAVGEYLDCHAALRGLERGSAKKAHGSLYFYLTEENTNDVIIPAGCECVTALGTAFVTTEAGSIAAGTTYCAVAAEAVEPGAGGNVVPYSVVYMMHAPTGVYGVVNDAAFTGGTDGEDDSALRERVMNSYRTLPNGANAAYYESKVLDLDNVAAVTVLPRNRGIGTVDVIFATYDGIPTEDEIEEVRELLDSEREICVDIEVSAPTTAAVNVTAALQIAAGRNVDEVLFAADAAIRAYFDGGLLSKAIFRAKLTAICMAIDGVENCTLTAPAADIAAADGVLPTLGTLSIREAV